MQWIKENPAAFVGLLPNKFVRTWWLTVGNEARTVSLPTGVAILYILFLSASVVGLALSLPRWRQLGAIYLLLAHHTANSLVFYGSTRLSVVMMPFLVLLAAFAADRLLTVAAPLLRRSFGAARLTARGSGAGGRASTGRECHE
jgi:hypothetical protein